MLIQKYKESWLVDFNDLKQVLEEALSGMNIRIEHVGSTSVPKLAAKGIIDIDIVYEKDVQFEEIEEKLEMIDYYHNGNQGIEQREVFKRVESIKEHNALDRIEHHLYVCPADSEELERHLLFRNHLIANERARFYYQNLKYRIAKEVEQDQTRYAELKERVARKFINSAIAKEKENTKSE